MQENPVRERMTVVTSDEQECGIVDRIEGDSIKLTKDQSGQHHWIPLTWVTRVDDRVHLDRPGSQAVKEWLSMPPEGRHQA